MMFFRKSSLMKRKILFFKGSGKLAVTLLEIDYFKVKVKLEQLQRSVCGSHLTMSTVG